MGTSKMSVENEEEQKVKQETADSKDEEMASEGENGNSSDEDSDQDDKDDSRILELEKQIEENPYLYDQYVELIGILSKQGELDKLRGTREKMSQVFPLTEELWLNWLRDEIKVSEDRESVKKLFEKAVKDYLNVTVWLEYVQYSIGEMGQEGGIQRVRDTFERALTACGLHPVLGGTIWEAYREFENALLAGLQPTPGSVPTAEQQDKLEAQTKRIDNLFRRQLSVPLVEMRTTFEEYKDWCSDEINPAVVQNYESAKAKMEARMEYEDQLLLAEPPKLEAYNKYIEYELSQKEPARIQCTFERAIQENCLVPDLWYKYTKFLDRHLHVTDVVMSVHQRAVRNCPWSADLWLGNSRAMERSGQDHNKVTETFEQALKCGDFVTSEDKTSIYNIWTAYCDYMRRRVDWTTDHENELAELRAIFDRASKHLYECYADPECNIMKYQARIEAKFCKNMETARELWNAIMQSGYGNQAATWLEYFNLERSFGDHKHCRKILQRALNSASDWPESVCEAYISFEREEGTLEGYDMAIERCEAQLERVNERRKLAEEKEASERPKKRPDRQDRKGGQDRRGGQGKKGGQKGKQKMPSPNQEKQDTPKWQKEVDTGQIQPYVRKRKADGSPVAEDNQSTEDGFKVPSMPPPKSKAPPPGFKGQPTGAKAPPPGYKGPPPGFVPADSDNQDEPPVKKIKEEELAEKVIDTSKYDRTVFLSNLHFNLDEQRIEDIFSKVGEISEVRLIKNIGGKSKGYAYVEFTDPAAVPVALAMDRQPVDNRPMYVSVCKENREEEKAFKFATGLEKNKLFIKGLSFKTSKEQLQEFFEQHGTVKDVRIVTHKNGQSKGLAYVEFESESAAAQAVMKTDGTKLDNYVISVAISNPPARKQPVKQREFVPTLGGGKRDMARGGKARTQLALVPRAVKSSTSDTSSATSETGPKMSNQDFRTMLLKK